MGGRMGGGRSGGAMGGARSAQRSAAPSRPARASGAAMGGGRAASGDSTRRMAQAPRTPQQRRARQQERRDARRERRMAQVGTPGTAVQQPGATTSGDEGWSGAGTFDLSGLFSAPEQPKDFRSVEFDESSLASPYQKYAEDPEDGWITGLMKSGQKGYDLPKEVTLAAAMNSPFRYYGGY